MAPAAPRAPCPSAAAASQPPAEPLPLAAPGTWLLLSVEPLISFVSERVTARRRPEGERVCSVISPAVTGCLEAVLERGSGNSCQASSLVFVFQEVS